MGDILANYATFGLAAKAFSATPSTSSYNPSSYFPNFLCLRKAHLKGLARHKLSTSYCLDIYIVSFLVVTVMPFVDSVVVNTIDFLLPLSWKKEEKKTSTINISIIPQPCQKPPPKSPSTSIKHPPSRATRTSFQAMSSSLPQSPAPKPP